MALTVAASIINFVQENKEDLITNSILEGRTMQRATLLTGVKNARLIPQLEVDPTLKILTDCDFTTSGSTILSARTVTVVDIGSQETLCPTKLEATFLSESLKKGKDGWKELPFEQMYAETTQKKITQKIDNLIWRGSTLVGKRSGQETLLNGVIAIIESESAGVLTASTRSNLTGTTTIVAATEAMVASFLANSATLDDWDEDDLTLFMSHELLNVLRVALINANLFHEKVDQTKFDEFRLPTHPNINCLGVKGMEFTDMIILMSFKNLVLAVDLESDFENFEFWESKDDRNIKFEFRSKLGVQLRQLNRIVVAGIQP